ncbi:MAG TPA: proline dehydrogenase family protein [Thermomicrobiales bacterium]|nr:proline dehydrogenase family protein [Thermomicrobiales bacterium]
MAQDQAETQGARRRRGISISPNALFRKLILLATQNRVVTRFVRRYGMRLGAARFVAGESWEEAIPALRRLNDQGFRTNTTLLGEALNDADEVARVVETYISILDSIAVEGLQTNIALKLTQLGLNLDEEFAYANVVRIATHAASLGIFIRIDMEESARVDATLRIFRRLRDAGHDNVGTVLQSALFRTADDLESLLPLKPNLRLVKGAYLEPPDVAYSAKRDVDRNYIRLAHRMLEGNSFTAIATHDARIIEHVIGYARRHDIPSQRFEFQMLYGISANLQRDLLNRGYSVLVATPFGSEWYYYLMRRLAERPANVLFLLKGLLRR